MKEEIWRAMRGLFKYYELEDKRGVIGSYEPESLPSLHHASYIHSEDSRE